MLLDDMTRALAFHDQERQKLFDAVKSMVQNHGLSKYAMLLNESTVVLDRMAESNTGPVMLASGLGKIGQYVLLEKIAEWLRDGEITE